MPAAIVKFDKNIGLTAIALEIIDSSGYDHSEDLDENGNLCLISGDARFFSSPENFIKKVYFLIIRKIEENGCFDTRDQNVVIGYPKCNFL